jgi:hypothetical protein
MMSSCTFFAADNMRQCDMPEPIKMGPSPPGEQIHRLAEGENAGDIKRNTSWFTSSLPGCHLAA